MKMKHSQTQEISHDPLVNANILNSHFASVGNRLASELPNSNRHFSNYLPRTTNSGSFVFETVLPSEIELEIIMAPSNKAHGLYSCPIRFLKCSCHIISKPIANIVNQSVCKGIFPFKLKHAKIITIYKDGNEDEHKASNKLEFFLFADVTNLLHANKNLRSLETVMNDELLKIVDWLTANKLSLNVKKSNYIIFHPYQKRLNYDVNIKIFDSRVNKYFNHERKEYVKYLGVMIDNHLSWKHHINYVALKICRNIGILSKLRHFVPPKTLYGIYNSLIFPYLSYGLVAWGQAAKTHLEKLLRLQKRAVRLINFAPFRSHAVPYFLHSNIMLITMLYFKLSSVLMFDVYNNTAPRNISHLLIPTQQIHSYSTRSSSSGNYYISHSRLNQKNDSFSIMGAKIWNSIPENLRNSSKSLFKEKVHTILLKIFQVQDRYADLNMIISDFEKY